MAAKVPPAENVAQWRSGTPTVDYDCPVCRQVVPVQGVTTVAGAIAALVALGQHQH